MSGLHELADDVLFRPVTVTLLDTVTGETRKDSRFGAYWWAYGNGSCDCNRRLVFEPDAEEVPCGNSRYYIVAVDDDESGYSLPDDYNDSYPPMSDCALHNRERGPPITRGELRTPKRP